MRLRVELAQGPSKDMDVWEAAVVRDADTGQLLEGVYAVRLEAGSASSPTLTITLTDFDVRNLPATDGEPPAGDLWLRPDPFPSPSALGFGAVIRAHEKALRVPTDVYHFMLSKGVSTALGAVDFLSEHPGAMAGVLGLTVPQESESLNFLIGVLGR